ncbi:NADH-quinone oxidoreductase subunit C [Pseudonocardia sp. K10HN5]|uniref:NADH-quinone oxidoreductase subunit C n=2 Tax=Pseudonocardia acidicola TaxID=2724939 RepID=A0ABX1S979_9PSEU|nr:NADH-quinone oxidoreductase subunit C [Pseudonocardia acidicola]
MALLAGAALAVCETAIEHGLLTVSVERAAWLPALEWARDELGCTFFDFLCGVDERDAAPAGISVVAHLHCPRGRHHLLLRTVAPAEDLRLPTATGLFRGANWHERETHEMFGVVFTGHPNLDPLLLPDGFEGHPLRKDFVLASRVAKAWPGAVNPGQSAGDAARRPGRNRPPGVPDPAHWGPAAGRAAGA